MTLFRRASAEPLWKEEFSVHTAEERYVSRRQFAKFLVLTSLAMFAGNLWILVKSWFRRAPRFPAVAIDGASEVPVGGVKLFTYPTPDDRCILVRTAADRFVAYSQKCTHLSCAVYYSDAERKLVCPCHKGFFSVDDGSVLAGPPPRPLPRIELEVSGGQVTARGVARSQEVS